MKLKTGRMQGGARFILRTMKDRDDLDFIDTSTGIIHKGVFVNKTGKRGGRWRIRIAEGDWRQKPYGYFEEKDLAASLLRQETESLPIEGQHKRNNIEAGMFQYSFHTRNNRTRHRGLFKHRQQAIRHCIWMNMRRLAPYIAKMTPGSMKNPYSPPT